MKKEITIKVTSTNKPSKEAVHNASMYLIKLAKNQIEKDAEKMMKKYAVMVINGIFEDENLLIISSKGSRYTTRFDEIITPEILHKELERNGIPTEDCKITVTGTDWKGKATIEQY